MKKLLFVLNKCNIGGPQKSLLGLLENFDYSMFDVNVIALEPGGALEETFKTQTKLLPTDPLITAATLPINNTLKYLFVFIKNWKLRMFIFAVKAILSHLLFKKNMNQERQQFWAKFHDQFPKLLHEYDIAFGVSAGLTTYFIVDCVQSKKKYHWIRSDYRILNLNKKIENEYFHHIDGALSVSHQCKDIFIKEFPYMEGKVRVLYNKIPKLFYTEDKQEIKSLQNDKNYKNILTVCRLDPLKGIELAIDACAILLSRGLKINWYVLGDGKMRSKIEEMIAEKGISNHFILLGFHLNTLAYIQQCDIYVHPSRTEGKSNAVDEAKYAGKPIVATNYSTVTEQIEHGVTGIICEMDGEKLANAVENLLINEQLQQSLSSTCLTRFTDETDFSIFF